MNSIHDGAGGFDLGQVDLNLLVALEALLRESSVTKAAERMHVTQSAMSHTLARLRELLGDPLLVRAGGGLAPTPRAEGLVAPLRLLLKDVSHFLAAPQAFDPTTARRIFRITSPDLVDILLLPPLHARLMKKAPLVDLAAVPLPSDIPGALAAGDLDLAILPALVGSDAPFGPQATGGLMQRRLMKDGFRVFFRKGHPLAKAKSLSKKRFLSTPHLLVSPTGTGAGLVDAVLAEQGEKRRIGLRVSTFAAALSVLEQSDLLLVGPSSLGRVHGVSRRLASHRAPLDLPEHTVSMVWHPRYGEEPGLKWLRDEISQVTGVWQ